MILPSKVKYTALSFFAIWPWKVKYYIDVYSSATSMYLSQIRELHFASLVLI